MDDAPQSTTSPSTAEAIPLIRNRRGSARYAAKAPVCVSIGPSTGRLVNLGEGGLAVNVAGAVPDAQVVPISLDFPEAGQRIEARGQIVWTNESESRVGLQFLDLPETSQLVKDLLSPRTLGAGQWEGFGARPRGEQPATRESLFTLSSFPATGPAPPFTDNLPSSPSSPGDDDLVARLRSAMSQAAEVDGKEPRPQVGPEQRARTAQGLGKPILLGVSICAAGLALAAGFALIRSYSGEIVAGLGQLKGTIAGVFAPSETGPPLVPVPRPGAAKSHRRRGEAKDQPGPRGLVTPSAADVGRRTDQSAKQVEPFQVEVVDSENQRHLVTPRGSTHLNVRFQGPPWAKSTAANLLGGKSDLPAAAPREPASDSSTNALTPAQGHIWQETSGDIPTQQIMPTYPPLALQRNLQGRVVLQVRIGKDGSVQSVRLVSGHPILAAAVMDAVKDWRYNPPNRNGGPVMEVDKRVTVDFIISID